MSDYLANLVTRTLSQAAVVRPQVPSLFEPSLASGQIKSELEFEQETLSEPTPITRRAETSLGEVESAPITHRLETPTSSAPSILELRQSPSGEPQPMFMHRTGTPASIPAPSQPGLREPEPVTPQASRPEGIRRATRDPEDIVQRPASKRRESRSNPGRAETNVEPVTPELGKNDSRAVQRESSSRRARASEAPTSVSQLSTPDSQPRSHSLVRPAATVQKIRAVEAVVPVIRSVPQFPPTPAPSSAPTINVTIGRVEIRATSSAPPPQRARTKPANALSLEEYLRRRASGASR